MIKASRPCLHAVFSSLQRLQGPILALPFGFLIWVRAEHGARGPILTPLIRLAGTLPPRFGANEDCASWQWLE